MCRTTGKSASMDGSQSDPTMGMSIHRMFLYQCQSCSACRFGSDSPVACRHFDRQRWQSDERTVAVALVVEAVDHNSN